MIHRDTIHGDTIHGDDGPSRLHTSCTALAVLILSACCLGQELVPTTHVHTPRADSRILPLPSDEDVFHFIIYGDRTGGPKEGIRVLEQAVRDTNLLAPDLVMTVGDLIQGYNERSEWMEQMREFRAVMKGLDCAWFPVAGNHDIYWRGPGRPDNAHESNYEKHFGPLWYWFEHKNAAFFVLYTDEGDRADGTKGFSAARHTQMSTKQIDWLRLELKKVRGKDHVFVFCHHPRWIEGRYRGNNWNAVHSVLRDAGNVRAVFGGHIHRLHYAGKRDGIEYLTLATTGGHLGAKLPQAGYLHHMNVVTVRKDRITHATIPIGAVMDPKEFTEAFTTEIDGLRRLAPRAMSKLTIDANGGCLGVCSFELENPSTREVEVALTPHARSDWSFGPDHLHAKIAAGEKKRFEIAFSRAASGWVGFVPPRLALQIDALGPGARIALPERSVAVRVALGELPASMFDAEDSIGLALDGRGACVEVSSQSLELPDGPLTLECWFRPGNMKGRRGLVTKMESSEFGLFVSDGVPSFAVHLGDGYVTVRDEQIAITRDEWHHIAGVFDGKELRLYLDGRLVSSRAGEGPRTRNELPLIVGGDTARRGPMSYFAGLIDEVRLSTTARYTGERIDPPRRFVPDRSTTLLLHCDKALGPWMVDHSAARAHGRRVGAARLVRFRGN